MPERDLRDMIVQEARGWIGTPYMHQASLKGVGCDCLGLVRGVWREVLGAEPEQAPPYSATWAEAGRRETLLEAAGRHMKPVGLDSFEPGDLLVFRWRAYVPAKHLAIAAGHGRMIHAQEHALVCEVALNSWWQRHLAAAFSFPVTES
jgi:NlpC/P60 family putative phage cell wall peptidase